MIESPWTDEQVRNLNEYQRYGYGHPFTCRDRGDNSHPHEAEYGDHGVLRATPQGWVCAFCPYTQNWAHEHMAQPQPDPNSLPGWERVSYWMGRANRDVPGAREEYEKAKADFFQKQPMKADPNVQPVEKVIDV